MSLRDIKAKARNTLHAHMRVEMIRYPLGDAEAGVEAYARVNSKDEAQGDLAGTSLAYAERRETIPKLIFLLADKPERRDVFVVSATEAYKIDTFDDPDQGTITAHVVRLTAAEITPYAAPGAE